MYILEALLVSQRKKEKEVYMNERIIIKKIKKERNTPGATTKGS